VIRPFRAEDAEAVSAMMRALNEQEGYDPEATPTPAALRENFLGPAARGRILVAQGDDGLTAFVSLIPTYSTVNGRRGAYLADVFVRAGHRRRGIGRALIAAAAAEARRDGGAFLWWTTLPTNPAARAFYAALGAEEEVLHAHTLEGEAFRVLAEDA
jgi:GNAT superfamily N-acetyltransferase